MCFKDLMPDCAITLYYCDFPGQTRFSYQCTHCSQGWLVTADGSIHPPSRRRIVRIRLNSYLNDPTQTAELGGFQFGRLGSFVLTDSLWTPIGGLLDLRVIPLTEGYPTDLDSTWTTPELAFDMTHAKDRFGFSLAVRVRGSDGKSTIDWDDPRIYDDGSQ